MRRTRLTIASLAVAASTMVLGMPATMAAAVSHQAGTEQVTVVADNHSGTKLTKLGGGDDDRRRDRRRRRIRIRRRHSIRWHHRCGPGWDSGYVRGRDRTRVRDRDRDRRRGGGEGDRDRRTRDRDFRDNGDRGWGRGWISTCTWRRGERTEYAAPVVAPVGAVKAGMGGSVSGIGTPEIAAGGALAALGLAGAFGATRRRSSSH